MRYLPYLALLIYLACGISKSKEEASVVEKNYQEPLGGLSISMVAVPGGIFQMGSLATEAHHQSDEGPVREVAVDGFWLASHEVSWDLYEQFLNRSKEGESFSPKCEQLGIEVDGISSASTPYIDMSGGMGKGNFPVTNITQHAALTFCKWLSAKTGHFYRLPTEAEWEYACKKGGLPASAATKAARAWTQENSANAYHPTASKQANSLGIYDMEGNVAEWTMDQYLPDFYQTGGSKNPWAYPDKLYPRTLRGGSWKDSAEKCNCTVRIPSKAQWKRIDPQLPKSKWWHTSAPFIGFRILRPFKEPSAEQAKKYWLPVIDDY
jgi:formylglycine-generating enzyme required for sulfatase activity